ncbi:MAG: PAS domain-containing protein, partial [Desulfuromonadaceae bacterium]|nr:PAS domain-containing protein [Desulfuromonadaceae bacterium]
MTEEKSDFSEKAYEDVKRAKLEYEHAFDAVSDLILIVDADHTITMANSALADRMGMDASGLTGLKCYEVMHGMGKPPVFCPHSAFKNGGKSVSVELELDSLKGIFEIIISPIIGDEGGLISTVHIARDVTEKKRNEKLIAAQQRELKELVASQESRIEKMVSELRSKDDYLIQHSRLMAMSEMISNIAHQWRQPLNNIGLIVQGIQIAFKTGELTEEELEADTNETMKVIKQMSETIDDFRDFFSHEEEESSFRISELLSNSISFIEPSFNRRGIKITVDETITKTLIGYRTELKQVFINILLNARDALVENKTEEPCIKVSFSQEGERAVV